METKIEVKEMPDMKAVYCRHMGAFKEIVKAYEKLIKWAEPRGLYIPNVTKSATVTHDDPSVTELSKVRQSACIYGSVLNALTITGYKGIDPEVSTDGLTPGYDTRDRYPSVRSFTFGVNVKF